MIIRALTLASLVGSVSALSGTASAQSAPAWTLVPDETVLVARIPGGAAFAKALREQTKLGSKLFSDERLQKIADLIGESGKLHGQGGQDLRDQLREALAKFDLKSDDLGELFQGEIGYALVVESRAGNPLPVGLAWLEPGGDLAERLVKAIATVVEESQDLDHPVRRVDLELAGNEVMHLSVPQVEAHASDDEFDDTPAPGQPDAKRNDAKRYEVGRSNLLVARLGNRLLAAHTFPESHHELLGDDPEHPNAVDWDEVTGLETAKGVFARFLQAHASASSATTSHLMDSPGLSEALPEGTPLIELLADARPLIKLADTAESQEAKRFIEMSGVDALGPIAYRCALDGTLLRSGLYISAPAPRRGLLQLLDQTALPAEVPDWAPANVLQFEQISFDLGKLVDRIKQLVAEYGGDGHSPLVQIDERLAALLQTDLESLVSSLGTTHTVISFPEKANAAPARPNALAGLMPTFNTRMALVWQLRDEPLWKRVLQFISQQAGGFIAPAEEQGFSGFRISQGLEGGLFVGRGYLVIGIGPEVCESVLAALRTPPTGGAALQNSSLYSRANELLPHEPALIYSLTDSATSLKGAKQTVLTLLEGPGGMLPGRPIQRTPERAAMIEKIKGLLPNDEELEGAASVSVTQIVVTDKGLISRSVSELPAP